MTPVERLISKLPGVKPAGKGWSARCPAHDDRRASLSIGEGDDGRVLVKCHAGCPVDSVCEALGLQLVDLMPSSRSLTVNGVNVNGNRRNPLKTSIPLTPQCEMGGPTFPTACVVVAELESRNGPRSASWTYHNAAGEPVGVVVRWDLPEGGKDIRPVSRHDGAWRIAGMPEPRPLYGLPDLASAHRVYVCEGEKAADAARSIGLTATTSVHGCDSPGKTDWWPLPVKKSSSCPTMTRRATSTPTL